MQTKTNNTSPLLKDKINLNYLPNDQKKHIDYVIQFKDDEDNFENLMHRRTRNKFIKQLIIRERFEIYQIVKKKTKPINTKSTYLLLHCPLDRLMEEAERMHLELPLKDVILILK